MKVIALAAVALSFFSVTVIGQSEDPGPSPTESIGCEPHGDHWYACSPNSIPIYPVVSQLNQQALRWSGRNLNGYDLLLGR